MRFFCVIVRFLRFISFVPCIYTDVENMPRVLNGLGIAILSTSKGVITDKEARDLNVGGEVICYVY